ncbi:hypothetical protein BVY03_01445 [bacterium K02(2017)]|nr:hypothetical protein BVY03_01445 [bacterium K02(2017)]
MIYQKEEIEAFLNALQLCIKSNVSLLSKKTIEADKTLSQLKTSKNFLFIVETKENDLNLSKVISLFKSYKLAPTSTKKTSVMFLSTSNPKLNLPDLTAFLLLTRLDDEKMRTLIKKNSRYKAIASQLNIVSTPSSIQIKSIHDASEFIFAEIENQNATLREVSIASNLTLGMLSKFKKGNDVKLSSLLKIIDALELKLTIEK